MLTSGQPPGRPEDRNSHSTYKWGGPGSALKIPTLHLPGRVRHFVLWQAHRHVSQAQPGVG